MGNLCFFKTGKKNEMVDKLLKNPMFMESLKRAQTGLTQTQSDDSSVALLLGAHMKDSGVDMKTIKMGEKLKLMHEDRIRNIDKAIKKLNAQSHISRDVKVHIAELGRQRKYSMQVVQTTMKNLMQMAHISVVENTTCMQKQFLERVANATSHIHANSEKIMDVSDLNADLSELVDAYDNESTFMAANDQLAESIESLARMDSLTARSDEDEIKTNDFPDVPHTDEIKTKDVTGVSHTDEDLDLFSSDITQDAETLIV